MPLYCDDCGCLLRGNICSNCQEELYILTFQNEDVDEVSPEFEALAEAQQAEVRERAAIRSGRAQRRGWLG